MQVDAGDLGKQLGGRIHVDALPSTPERTRTKNCAPPVSTSGERKEKRKVSTTPRIWDWTKSSSSSSSTLYTNSKKKKKKRKREINGAFDVSCTTTTRETNLPRRDATSRGSGRKPRD